MDGDAEEDDGGADEGVAGLVAEGEDEQESGSGDEEDGDDGIARGAEWELGLRVALLRGKDGMRGSLRCVGARPQRAKYARRGPRCVLRVQSR